ncbi:MAG: DHH family phosphoesterase [Pseudoflavonifractor sp.]
MNYREAAALLAGQDQILILTHKRPDGDTIGCAAGLCAGLRRLGKSAFVLPNLDATSLLAPYLEGYLAAPDFIPDFVVSVDIAGRSLFGENALPYLEAGIDLALDHHPSNEGFAKENCVDGSRAACGELIYDMLCLWAAPDKAAALPLYVALSTDTGCFMYANTSPATHRIAAALMETGIDYTAVNKRHFRTKSFKRLQLERMLTQQLELFDGGETAIVTVTLAMLAELNAKDEDSEDIAAFVAQVEGASAAVTIREVSDRECKMSVRTTVGLNASDICAQMGGGGHAGAAGCAVKVGVAEAKALVLAAIGRVRHG